MPSSRGCCSSYDCIVKIKGVGNVKFFVHFES